MRLKTKWIMRPLTSEGSALSIRLAGAGIDFLAHTTFGTLTKPCWSKDGGYVEITFEHRQDAIKLYEELRRQLNMEADE